MYAVKRYIKSVYSVITSVPVSDTNTIFFWAICRRWEFQTYVTLTVAHLSVFQWGVPSTSELQLLA